MKKRTNARGSGGDFFVGGGEMGGLMRAFPWETTELGPVEQWPQSLRVAVRILLGSGYPMYIGWGPRFIQFYNDAYFPILGVKHPAALGIGTPQTFPEIWEFIGPMFGRVMEQGEATTLFDQILYLERNGYPEECYFTFSYSPIPLETGGAGGVFVTALETSHRVIEERRLTLLRDLAGANSGARSQGDMLTMAAKVLANDLHDMPFSLIYEYDEKQGLAVLAGSAGVPQLHPIAPAQIRVEESGTWPLQEALQNGGRMVVKGLSQESEWLPKGPWAVPPEVAAVLPIQLPAQAAPFGFLIVAINPHKRIDAAYEAFLQQAARQIARNAADALAYQAERQRAEELAALDHAKTAFFSNVSHEFRTPLTLLLGPLEQMREKDIDDILPENRKLVDVAHRNAMRLLRLVNMLLDVSRIEAGRMQAVYQPTDLCVFTQQLASVFQSTVERGGLKFDVKCEAIGEPVYVDRDMWEKIVLNLVSNAFKFTLDGGITVSLRDAGAHVEFAVKDTGVGIPQAELPKVFDRFHRVEGSRGRSFEGSGIGLSLVQELVQLHGGTVRAESVAGRGSTFTVSIPKGTEHLPHDRLETSQATEAQPALAESYVEEARRWLPETAESGEEEPQTPMPFSRATILVVDDNADMRKYVSRLLAKHYTVTTASNGKEGVEALQNHAVDLVITDIMMPVVDGFALVRAIREDERTRLLPILMLSARAGEESKVEGFEGGADDYLVKPFTTRELLARVRAHLQMARMRKQAAEQERSLRAEITAERNRLREAVSALEKSEAALRFAQQAANIGSWELNVNADEIVLSEEAARMLGREHLRHISRSDFLDRLNYATDRDNFTRALERTLRKRVPFETEFRLDMGESVHLLAARATMFYNQGNPVLIGFFIQVGAELENTARGARK